MQLVHLYAETGSVAPRNIHRSAGYVLEYITPSGKTVTREEFREQEGTYNVVTVEMITEGLQRLKCPCEVHIHTQNRYVLLMIDTRMEEWEQNGYRTARGEKLANWEEWEKLGRAAKEHLLIPEPGEHPYLGWMKNEMRKTEKADKSQMKKNFKRKE